MIEKLWKEGAWYIKLLMVVLFPLLLLLIGYDIYEKYLIGSAKKEALEAEKREAALKKEREVIEERIKKIDDHIKSDTLKSQAESRRLKHHKENLLKKLEEIDEDWHLK